MRRVLLVRRPLSSGGAASRPPSSGPGAALAGASQPRTAAQGNAPRAPSTGGYIVSSRTAAESAARWPAAGQPMRSLDGRFSGPQPPYMRAIKPEAPGPDATFSQLAEYERATIRYVNRVTDEHDADAEAEGRAPAYSAEETALLEDEIGEDLIDDKDRPEDDDVIPDEEAEDDDEHDEAYPPRSALHMEHTAELLKVLPRDEERLLAKGFPDWTAALGAFFARYVPPTSLGKSWLPPPLVQFAPPASRPIASLEAAAALPLSILGARDMQARPERVSQFEPGSLHWTDDAFLHGFAVCKIKTEVLPTSGPGYMNSFGEDEAVTIVKRAMVVSWRTRDLYAIQVITKTDGESEDKAIVRSYPLSSQWLTALKALKWPAPWMEESVLEHLPDGMWQAEDMVLQEYPLAFDMGVRRF